MEKFLLGLSVALITFVSGILTTNILRFESESFSKPLFEREIVEIPIYQVAPPAAPEKIESPETLDIPEKFELPKEYLWAWYSLNNYPQMPEVNMIRFDISHMTFDGIETDEPIFSAGVYTTLSKDIHEGFAKSVWVSFENDKLKFKTKRLKGIEYRFEGVFFKNKKTGEAGEKILRGTLQKFIKGKKVAQVSGDFAFYEPYCLS